MNTDTKVRLTPGNFSRADFTASPYGDETYNWSPVVDGCGYYVGESFVTNCGGAVLVITDHDGEHIDSLRLSPCKEYWHTRDNAVHIGQFPNLDSVICWAITVAE